MVDYLKDLSINLIHICLLIYWIKFIVNKEYIGKDIEFIINTTIKKINKDNRSNVAIGG